MKTRFLAMAWGDGMDMYQQLEDGLGPCAQYCPCEASEQKMVKNRNLKIMCAFNTIRFVLTS